MDNTPIVSKAYVHAFLGCGGVIRVALAQNATGVGHMIDDDEIGFVEIPTAPIIRYFPILPRHHPRLVSCTSIPAGCHASGGK
jgi:hypothetical protein